MNETKTWTIVKKLYTFSVAVCMLTEIPKDSNNTEILDEFEWLENWMQQHAKFDPIEF